MCGISGYIGQALHPKASYALMTNLALKTQDRGKEATGIWGAQGGQDGQIIYHKEPVTATEFVGKPEWKKLKTFNPQLLLLHCREPTQSAGLPKTNRNNHPHVSQDCTVALIHNGKVEEYHKHRNRLDSLLKSQCDSEMILRIFETGEYVPNAEFLKEKYPHLDPGNAFRVFGCEEIFKKLDKSAFACAVGERHEGTMRSLWMFRNEKRPLHMIDLRAEMGQIFFCSTMSIWREAVEATHEIKNIIPMNHMVVEFPVQYAYAISFDPDAADEVYTQADADSGSVNADRVGQFVEGGWKQGWKVRKYKLTLSREYGEEEEEQIKIPDVSPRPPRQVQVYTKLNEDDEIVDQAGLVQTVSAATGNEDVVETPEQVNKDADPPDPDPADTTTVVAQISGKIETSDDLVPQGDVRVLTHEPESVEDDEDSTPASPFSHEPEDVEEEDDVEVEEEDGCDLERLADLCDSIKRVTADIQVEAHNNAMAGDIKPKDFRDILDELEQHYADLQGTLYTAKSEH